MDKEAEPFCLPLCRCCFLIVLSKVELAPPISLSNIFPITLTITITISYHLICSWIILSFYLQDAVCMLFSCCQCWFAITIHILPLVVSLLHLNSPDLKQSLFFIENFQNHFYLMHDSLCGYTVTEFYIYV